MKWILRRTLQFTVEILAGLIVAFMVSILLPSNPLRLIVQTTYVLRITFTLHGAYLESPVLTAFLGFLTNIFRGNWGWSVQYQEPAIRYVASVLPWTLTLIVPTVLLTVTLGSLMGVALAQVRSKLLQSIPMVILTVLNSTPNYIIATLVWLFLSYRLRLFPTAGNFSGSSTGSGYLPSFPFVVNVAYHYALPVLSLWLSVVPNWSLYMRSVVITNISEDYVRFAQARGVRGIRLKATYIGRTSLMPLIANVPYTFSTLLSGTVFIEQIYTLQGVGSALYASIGSRDFDVTLSLFTIFVLIVIIGNYLTDVTYSIIDPRVKQ
jgi:peptide/nickel transport system permease protein